MGALEAAPPQSPAGWRKFGNELKAELWEGPVSVVITREGKAGQTARSHRSRVGGREQGLTVRGLADQTGSAQLSDPPRLAFGEVITHQCINHSSNKCSLRFFPK